MTELSCRFCSKPLHHVMVDLGASPVSNNYLKIEDLQKMEPFYPLCVYVCDSCFLVQLPEHQKPEEIFRDDYAYFSSYSESWLNHAHDYVQMMIKRFGYSGDSQIVEVASNDGYLLQYFKAENINVLGVEPASNVAQVAIEKGIDTEVAFFGKETAEKLREAGKSADLLLGNNVLAHVPDINDFVQGIKILLKKNGVSTMEFPHLLKLRNLNQFDTIYHEHFSYLSLFAVNKIFSHHGLTLFDVEQLSTHGGSLRVFARHDDDSSKPVTKQVIQLLEEEKKAGFDSLDSYLNYKEQVDETKRNLLSFLIQAKKEGKTIVGYGAPAKGNTLLNYCGIRGDFLDFTVDRSPHKQGQYLPGTHIPIFSPDAIIKTRPDYVLILPWNLKEEIMEQMAEIRDWGGKFIVPIPELTVFD